MELKDFVAETLGQIIIGVSKSQGYALAHDAVVNPARTSTVSAGDRLVMRDCQTDKLLQFVEFDVAVTTIEGTTTKGGIGVFVGSVGLGAQGQSDQSNTSVSRIKFSVPVSLPTMRRGNASSPTTDGGRQE